MTLHRDRRSWGAGPWQEEPDQLEFTTSSGILGYIWRGPLGALCGYARLPTGHPWIDLGYDDIPAEVHGGLTFKGPRDPDPHAVWVGFDTAHFLDYVPGMAKLLASIPGADLDLGETYWTIDMVKAEIEDLANQIVAASL